MSKPTPETGRKIKAKIAEKIGNQPKHSPTPWEHGGAGICFKNSQDDWATSIHGPGKMVAYITQGGAKPEAEAKANATLFLAAPDLLKFAQDCQALIDRRIPSTHLWNFVVMNAPDVIKKATQQT